MFIRDIHSVIVSGKFGFGNADDGIFGAALRRIDGNFLEGFPRVGVDGMNLGVEGLALNMILRSHPINMVMSTTWISTLNL